MLYSAFLLARHPKSARSHVNIYNLHPQVMRVPWTNLTRHSRLHLDLFSLFPAAHGRVRILYSVRENVTNFRLKKLVAAIKEI